MNNAIVKKITGSAIVGAAFALMVSAPAANAAQVGVANPYTGTITFAQNLELVATDIKPTTGLKAGPVKRGDVLATLDTTSGNASRHAITFSKDAHSVNLDFSDPKYPAVLLLGAATNKPLKIALIEAPGGNVVNNRTDIYSDRYLVTDQAVTKSSWQVVAAADQSNIPADKYTFTVNSATYVD